MGGRRLLANIPGKRIADAGEAEARSEQRPGIGHQRKAGEAIDDGLGQDRLRRRPQDVAAGKAEGYDPRPEAGRHRQGIGTVLERDERPRLGRLEKAIPHRSGSLMVPSMTRRVSPDMTTFSPLSSHQRSPPRGDRWRLWIIVLPILSAQ